MDKNRKDERDMEEKLKELEVVFQSSHEEIFVSDADGVCIAVNPACERHYGLQGIDLLGRNVHEIEKEGVFFPSATVKVLKEKRKVSMIQSTSAGRRLLVTANPVFDDNGNLIRVVSNSMDITEIISLKKRIEKMEKVIHEYNFQLERFKQHSGITESFVAKSKSMIHVLEILKRISQVDTSVLLLGESGVGKTEVARVLHKMSSRKEGPFTELNCGAIPTTLFESELFGYEKGAFSGANSSGKKGLLEAANQGTLFLDEIGELPMESQSKLLKVLQSKSFIRVGGTTSISVDVRFIAATNQDLFQKVKRGEFREDLYYRLNVVPITIPPLRERHEDLAELIFIILNKLNNKYQTNKMLSSQTMSKLLSYSLPGNVRELENILERMVITSEEDIIFSSNFTEVQGSFEKQNYKNPKDAYIEQLLRDEDLGLQDMISDLENEIFSRVKEEQGTTRKIAERLKISQSKVSRKFNEHELD